MYRIQVALLGLSSSPRLCQGKGYMSAFLGTDMNPRRIVESQKQEDRCKNQFTKDLREESK